MKRILSIVLLLTVLISTSSFRVEIHYCNGEFQSFALIGGTKCEKCEKKTQKKRKKCCKKKKKQEQKKCCSYSFVDHEGDQDLTKVEQNVTPELKMVAVAVFMNPEVFIPLGIESSADISDPPPLLYSPENIQSEFQVFII